MVPNLKFQVGSVPPTGAKGKTYREKMPKQRKTFLIDYSLKPNLLFVIGCPYCFDFITLRHIRLEVYRLRFGLLT